MAAERNDNDAAASPPANKAARVVQRKKPMTFGVELDPSDSDAMTEESGGARDTAVDKNCSTNGATAVGNYQGANASNKADGHTYTAVSGKVIQRRVSSDNCQGSAQGESDVMKESDNAKDSSDRQKNYVDMTGSGDSEDAVAYQKKGAKMKLGDLTELVLRQFGTKEWYEEEGPLRELGMDLPVGKPAGMVDQYDAGPDTKKPTAREDSFDDESSDDSSANSFWDSDDRKLPAKRTLTSSEDTDDLLLEAATTKRHEQEKRAADEASLMCSESFDDDFPGAKGRSPTKGAFAGSGSMKEKKMKGTTKSLSPPTSNESISSVDHASVVTANGGPQKKQKTSKHKASTSFSTTNDGFQEGGRNGANEVEDNAQSKKRSRHVTTASEGKRSCGKMERDFDPAVGDRVWAEWAKEDWHWGQVTAVKKKNKFARFSVCIWAIYVYRLS